MGHHIGDAAVSARLVARFQRPDLPADETLSEEFHRGLPASAIAGVEPKNCIAELERCVNELGFVGCNLNPDPAGGYWKDPPLTDKWWYPLYEKMVELERAGDGSCHRVANRAFHTTGSHYINGDTTAFMQFLMSDIFKDFPTLKFIIPAWRRRGSLSLGPLSRHCAGPEAAAAVGIAAEQRVLRHLRLSSARHRSPDQGHSRQEHPVRLGDGRCGQGHRSGDRVTSSTTPSAISTSPLR